MELAGGGAVGGLPQSHDTVIASAGDEGAIGTDGYGAHPSVVGFDDAAGWRVFCGGVPPSQGVVAASGNQSISVWGDGQSGDP